MSLTAALNKLSLRHALEAAEMEACIELIASGQANPVQVGAFLVLLHAKGETGEEIATIAKVMRSKAVSLAPPPKTSSSALVDIVGTGGDGHNTVNISTAASVLACALGVRIAKHGNRSASSLSGSADVLEALGIPMLGPSTIGTCIDEAGIGFIFAPLFHPAMSHVGPTRKALGVRTVFNILGPLLNPALPRRMVLGVFAPSLLDKYAHAVKELGAEHVVVAHCCGLDEFATIGPTSLVEVRGSSAVPTTGSVDPLQWGVKQCTIKDLEGGDAAHNAKVLRAVLGGSEDRPGISDTVALNAGAVLYVAGLADSIHSGFQTARQALSKGIALAKLDQWIAVASRLKAEEDEVEKKKVKQ